MVDMPMPREQIASLLEEGRLADAIGTTTAAVKAAPTDVAERILLAELLMLQGAYERADNHLKIAADQAPLEQITISRMRWILRAAEARRAWYEERGVPGFIGEPTKRQRDVLRLSLLMRDGEMAGAETLRAQLEDEPAPDAIVDGGALAPVRDICDLSQHGFEALTLDGRYLWIAPEQISDMRLEPVKRPSDLVWRKTDTLLRDGRDATFFLVAQYYDAAASDEQKLGMRTDWVEEAAGVVRGRGQKILLVGDDTRDFLGIERISARANA